MVEAPCRALMAAARWNGHAAQATTGRARTATTQPQWGNWKAGNMEIATTGTVRAAAVMSRGRSLAAAFDGLGSLGAAPPETPSGSLTGWCGVSEWSVSGCSGARMVAL